VDTTAVRAMRLILADQPLSDAKVRFAWTIVAGPAVVRASTVSFADGTLVVRTQSDSWFQAVQRSRSSMLQRLGQLLGPDIVRTIVVANDDGLHRTLHHRP
jgi:Dna[CI] antecedent, DciA